MPPRKRLSMKQKNELYLKPVILSQKEREYLEKDSQYHIAAQYDDFIFSQLCLDECRVIVEDDSIKLAPYGVDVDVGDLVPKYHDKLLGCRDKLTDKQKLVFDAILDGIPFNQIHKKLNTTLDRVWWVIYGSYNGSVQYGGLIKRLFKLLDENSKINTIRPKSKCGYCGKEHFKSANKRFKCKKCHKLNYIK